ncbi:MAG: T9SS type A sorting domain-containing protein [candidate division Zixibacteria bacterium]|nr:T9SS type A sorting domain-containing protein [candidate division Zixibacteria bacterium]
MKRLIVLLATLLLSFGLISAANTVDLVGTGSAVKADTIWTGMAVEMQVSVENDIHLGGIGFGFNLNNPEGGVTLSYPAQVDGFGYYEAITVNPASRMFPTASVWDLGNLIVSDTGLDMANAGLNGTLPDTVNIGGVALMGGLPVGAMEHMLSLHFIASGPGVGVFETLCMDSGFIPPAAPFVFIDGGGSTLAPVVTWGVGGLCFVVSTAPNFCPEFSGATSMNVDHCGSNSVVLSADDVEDDAISFGLTSTSGGGSAVVNDNGDGTCNVSYTAVAGDVGSAVDIVVYTTDAFHDAMGCNFHTINVTATNNAPTIDCGAAYNPIGINSTFIKDDIVGNDVDACDGLIYAMVSGDGAIDASTGVYSWSVVLADAGLHTIVVSVTDGFGTPVECSFEVDVLITEPFEIRIEKLHDIIQGHFYDLPVSIVKGSEAMGGFDFLFAYDNSLLTFTEASLSTYFAGCGWEYFTYRHGSHGNCGNGCPSGEIRVVGLAETNNGPYHPDFDCIGAASLTDEVIFNLTFFVTTDVNANDMFAQVNFFWMDCGDNTISVVSGDTLAMSRFVYFYYGEGGLDTYADRTDNDWGFPGQYGAHVDCEVSTPKGAPIRFIDLYNGGIDIIDKDIIDDRGDLNMDGVANTVADAVMFTNYFIAGLSAFMDHVDGSIAASDINADGTALTVADLVYLVRVIIGDAQPYANKPVPGSMFNVEQQGNVFTLNPTEDAGAALFVFNVNGEVGTPTINNNMDVVSSVNGSELRVLVYNIGSEAITEGTILDIPVNGSLELIEVEAATYGGAVMETTTRVLPTSFSVAQNYPNPFNPTTTISFDLNVASEWTVDIYNIAGQKVNTFNGFNEVGNVNVVWDSKDASNASVASGIYFYKVTAGANSATHKMVLMK